MYMMNPEPQSQKDPLQQVSFCYVLYTINCKRCITKSYSKSNSWPVFPVHQYTHARFAFASYTAMPMLYLISGIEELIAAYHQSIAHLQLTDIVFHSSRQEKPTVKNPNSGPSRCTGWGGILQVKNIHYNTWVSVMCYILCTYFNDSVILPHNLLLSVFVSIWH